MQLSSPHIHATCPSHLILLNFVTHTILGEQYKSISFSLCSFLHSPVASSLLGQNMLLNTLFSYTLSLRSSINMSDQVSHSYKTRGKIIVPCIFMFLDINYPKFILFVTPAKFEIYNIRSTSSCLPSPVLLRATALLPQQQ